MEEVENFRCSQERLHLYRLSFTRSVTDCVGFLMAMLVKLLVNSILAAYTITVIWFSYLFNGYTGFTSSNKGLAGSKMLTCATYFGPRFFKNIKTCSCTATL